MKLDYLVTLNVELGGKGPAPVGPGPFGTRLVAGAAGGTFHGPRLMGKILPGGGDYILSDQNGIWHLDVRLVLETDDGAFIYLQYAGVLEMNDKIREARAAGRAMEFGEAYFMIQPRFETGDPRYAWLNGVVSAGEGRIAPGRIEYKIYALENG